jgi:CBS domain-containing protein
MFEICNLPTVTMEFFMKAKDIMTCDCSCCFPASTIKDAAELMMKGDFGCVPIVESAGRKKLSGVLTDRDITSRVVAKAKDPSTTHVRDIMSRKVVSAKPDTSLTECCRLMAENRVRRLPIVDDEGILMGMVAQADVALHASATQVTKLLQAISAPSRHQHSPRAQVAANL